MRKVIAIGEAGFDIVFDAAKPVAAYPGGRILNAAASLARAGVPTSFVGECGADYFGDLIAAHLQECGVDIRPLDRFTEGTTAITTITPSGHIAYGTYPDDRFDVVWPRIDENDILLFGSHIAVEADVRTRLFEIVRYAKERKAVIAYLPGFAIDKSFRATRILTALLENLEIADLVITCAADIEALFETADDAEAYREHIGYYCPNYVHADASRAIRVHQPSGCTAIAAAAAQPASPLGWIAGLVAGTIAGLIAADVTAATVGSITAEQLKVITDHATRFAASAGSSAANVIDRSISINPLS